MASASFHRATVFLLALAWASPVLAGDAPFGLRWGANVAELKIAGVGASGIKDDGILATVIAGTAPQAPADTAEVRLQVHRQYGLQRIVWRSRDLGADPAGALDSFHRRQDLLSREFGPPRSVEEDLPPGTQPFFPCLAQDGCASIVAVWRTGDVDVRLRLSGSADGRGWLETVYLGPDWNDVAQQIKGHR
jgi:hypothetical protein